MDKLYDLNRRFEYENGFYATADPSRFSKIITHRFNLNGISHN